MKYFAYGSNMNFKHMQKRCPDCQFLHRAFIGNYRLVYDGKSVNWPGFSCANIIPSDGDLVWGGLFEISERDIQALDGYEHYPQNYQREEIEVRSDNLETIKAIVYAREPKKEGPARDKYVEMIIEGAKDCGLPGNYVSVLAGDKVKA